MTLKDVERRHEDRLKIVCSIMSASRIAEIQPTVMASTLVQELEAERTKDLQLVTQFTATAMPGGTVYGPQTHTQISSSEAEAALRGPKTATDIPTAHYRSIYDGNVIRSSQETPKATQEPLTSMEEIDKIYRENQDRFIEENSKSKIPNPSYRSIMEDAIRCGAVMPKTTQTPITSLEELDNLYQQIREQFIKEHP